MWAWRVTLNLIFYLIVIIITVIKSDAARRLALTLGAVLGEWRRRRRRCSVVNKWKTHIEKKITVNVQYSIFVNRFLSWGAGIPDWALKNMPRRGAGSFHYRYIFIWVINGHLEVDKNGTVYINDNNKEVSLVCPHLTHFICCVRRCSCGPRWSLGCSL